MNKALVTTAPGTNVSSASRVFADGEVVAGAYEVRRVLGQGAMGQVYEARDVLINRDVALKVLWPELDPQVLRHEAEALAAVRHAGVPTVHMLGTHRGIGFIVMELVRGLSLEDFLRRRAATGDPIELGEALRLVIAVADVLAAVHHAGIAHRDVKPSNVLLAPDNRIVLSDFGLVVPELAARDAEAAGTPSYLAPEVILREVRRGLAHASDLYALGVMAYEVLTGELPFMAPSVPEIFRLHIVTPPPRASEVRPDIPPSVDQILVDLMAKEGDDRPSAELVAARLRRIRQSLARGSPPPLRALVVDDDPTMAALIARCAAVGLPGARVEIVHAADAAVRAIHRERPTIIILDLNMPAMNGLELCMYLRGADLVDDGAVVAVSGTAVTSDEALLHQLGVKFFVPKGPGFIEQLGGVLRELRLRLDTTEGPASR